MWSRRLLPHVKRTTRYCSNLKVKEHHLSDVHALKPGEKHYGFLIRTVQEIPEFRLLAVLLHHEKTKAQYLHLHRDDPNNAFSINFRTTPMNSTGSPHILEHTVLCGSELYPVRDPFFKMLNRSLATFMNAMTGSDYTLYPFSTQNYSDFKNLQKVYLDAAFRPLLTELDFMQEGWRLENVDPHDPKTDLIIKGVVYNEMKGVFSENDSILAQKLQNLILPDHTYGYVSGGEPSEIPNLTWDQLRQFHKEHYHPSNARFYSYGCFPLLPSLEYIDREYLSKYAHSPMHHTEVPKQKRWTETKSAHISCLFNDSEPIEKQNFITISLLLSDNTDIYETFLMNFLKSLLLEGPNAPFYKTLIEPNFSGGFTPSTGFDAQSRDTIFNIGIMGVKKEDFKTVTEAFDKTIDEVVEKGFEQQHIESVLHRFELSIKHETSNFGLNLLFGLTPIWNHTEDVVKGLQVNALLERLRNELKSNPKYLQDVVKVYFKENPHKLILTMSADKNYLTQLEKDEKKTIKKKVKALSDSDRKVLFEKCLKLEEQQNTPPNTHLLPTLTINDIDEDIEKLNKVQVTTSDVQTQITQVNSNSIVYFKSILNTVELSPEQQMLLPLFCHVIGKLGTDKLNYLEFDSLSHRKTSGLKFKCHIGESLFHLHTYEPGLELGSYCLEKNVENMWELWGQIFTLTKLEDVKRFQTLTQLYMANLKQGIADSGHVYAMQAASALVSGSAYQVELMSGLHHISYMKRLIDTSNYRAMLDEILNIARIVFDRKKMRVALNISPENQTNILRSYENFTNSLPETAPQAEVNSSYLTGKVWAPVDAVNCEHHVLNLPVNFCSKAILAVPYTDPHYAKMKVLAKLLSSKYLLPELREKNGAYGGGARLTADGVFSFFSYRDPRHLRTLDVFDNSYKWFQDNFQTISDQDVFEAKLGVFQQVDHPVPPSQKGGEEFKLRLTPEMKQRHRAELMSVNKAGLKEVVEKYLGDKNVLNTGKVVIGSKSEKMDVTKRENELWTVVDSV